MQKSRIEALEQMLRSRPQDPFARYGLAMELFQSGNLEEARKHFAYLLRNHADYLPAYYQAGTLLARLEQVEEARKVFSEGIQLARHQGNLHTENELQAARDELEE